MALNTIDEIIQFARLSFEVVQPSEVQDALNFAMDIVDAESPLEDNPRSVRLHPLRKRAEAYLATAELYDKIGPFLALTTPGKQVLTTIGISIGTDSNEIEGPFNSNVDLQTAQIRGTLSNANPEPSPYWEGVETCRAASQRDEGKVQTTNRIG